MTKLLYEIVKLLHVDRQNTIATLFSGTKYKSSQDSWADIMPENNRERVRLIEVIIVSEQVNRQEK